MQCLRHLVWSEIRIIEFIREVYFMFRVRCIKRLLFVATLLSLCLFSSAIAAETFVEDGIVYQVVSKREVEVVGYEGTITDLDFDSYVNGYSVRGIAAEAFKDCKTLETVDMPYGIKKIGVSAFEGCSALTEVSVASSVEKLEKWVFKNCTALSTVDLPYGLKQFGDDVFIGCENLTTLSIPSSVDVIPKGFFKNNTTLSSIDLPYGIKKIEESAFEGCVGLTIIEIPSSVDNIAKRSFYGCTQLEEVDIPYGIKQIKESAFENCTSLTAVEIPSSVKSVDKRAFFGCSALTNVDIAYGAGKIGDMAFGDCVMLYSVDIGSKNTQISENAFRNTPYIRGESAPATAIPTATTTVAIMESQMAASPTPTASPIPTIASTATPEPVVKDNSPRYDISVDVECVANWFFSTYNINISVDGEKYAVLTHGASETYCLSLTEGTHTLRFANESDGSLFTDVTIHISGESRYFYKLTCYSFEVHVDRQIAVPMSAEDYQGKPYADVQAAFEDLGFTEVVVERQVITLEEARQNGDVAKIRVDGNSFNAGDKVSASAKVKILYNEYVQPTPTPYIRRITPENNTDFASILVMKADIDPAYAQFATEYRDEVIEFDGHIAAIAHHESYKTRWDILAYAGDYDPKHISGPAFKFEDVGSYELDCDLRTNQNVHIVAKVLSYNSNNGLFFLKIVSITER